jgi:violaxanthin de-epoxidase
VIDYAYDGNPEGVPPFAFIYYRGQNDAWVGYGGAVVYTRDSTLPTQLLPRLRAAAKKVKFDFDKDFTITDNTCKAITDGDALLLKEKFAGKVFLQSEKQLQAQAVKLRNASVNSIKAQELFFSDELGQAQKAVEELSATARDFEKEISKKVETIEEDIVQEVVEISKDVVQIIIPDVDDVKVKE